MESYQEWYREAVGLENRGRMSDATKQYEKLVGIEVFMQIPELGRTARFFASQGSYREAFKFAEEGLKKGGGAEEFVPVCIEALEHIGESPSGKGPYLPDILEQILKLPGSERLLEQQLKASQMLFRYDHPVWSWRLAQSLLSRLEHDFNRYASESGLYIQTLLHLIKLYYSINRMTQARLYLRRLLSLEESFFKDVETLAKWSLLLDETPMLVKRPDWPRLQIKLGRDTRFLCGLFHCIATKQRQKLPEYQEALQGYKCEDQDLANKLPVLRSMTDLFAQSSEWGEGIEALIAERPYDRLLRQLVDKRGRGHISGLENESKVQLQMLDSPAYVKTQWDNRHAGQACKNRRSLHDVNVVFFGGGERIGGTSILVTIGNSSLLLDAGLHLNEDYPFPDYSRAGGVEMFTRLDALLLTHAHMDHIGSLPYVHGLNRELPIYATEPTIRLMRPMLRDLVKTTPGSSSSIYTDELVQSALHAIQTVDFGEAFTLPSKSDGHWEIEYFPSGHILGAGAILIRKDGATVLFTGDFSMEPQKTVSSLLLPENLEVDVLITETTYGYLPPASALPREMKEELLVQSVMKTIDKNGCVLIPSFSLGRAQEVLLTLQHAYRNEPFLPFDLYLDGRAVDITRVYQQYAVQGRYIKPDCCPAGEEDAYFFGRGVLLANDHYRGAGFPDFVRDLSRNGRSVVIASSGMLMDGTMSAAYAEHWVEDDRNSIIFSGYLDYRSPGAKLLAASREQFNPRVIVNGKEKELRANVGAASLSAHAGREEIVQLALSLQPQYILLMHGEHDKRYTPPHSIRTDDLIYPSVTELLEGAFGKTKVIPAFNGESYSFM